MTDEKPKKTEPWHELDVDDPSLEPWQRLELIEHFGEYPRAMETNQRRQVVFILLMERGWSQTKTAKLLRVNQSLIAADKKTFQKQYEKMIREGSVMSCIANLNMTAATAKNMARSEGDYKELWNIEKELFDRFQKVGLIPEMPKRVVVEEDDTPTTRNDLIKSIIGVLTEDFEDGDEIPGLEEIGLLPQKPNTVDTEIL